MTRRGCGCCGGDPPACTAINKSLTNGGGTAFNSTDWSCSVTPSVEGVDHLLVDTGTLTPSFSMPANSAYYVHVFARSTTGSLSINMGTNSLSIDFSAETIQINANDPESFPSPTAGVFSEINVYFCPTHSMGEILHDHTGGGPDGTFGDGDYGMTVLDTAAPSVTQSWTISTSGEVELKTVTYSPADVIYSGATKTTDCGRHDLFPCHWKYVSMWNDVGLASGSPTYEEAWLPPNLDMTFSGYVYPIEFWTGTRMLVSHSGPTGSPNSLLPSQPDHRAGQDPSNLCNFKGRSGVWQESDFFPGEYGAFSWDNHWNVTLQFTVQRDDPTPATPYPSPYARATILFVDLISQADTGCSGIDSASVDVALAAISTGWTLQVTLDRTGCSISDSTTLTWNFPYV